MLLTVQKRRGQHRLQPSEAEKEELQLRFEESKDLNRLERKWSLVIKDIRSKNHSTAVLIFISSARSNLNYKISILNLNSEKVGLLFVIYEILYILGSKVKSASIVGVSPGCHSGSPLSTKNTKNDH